MKKLEIKKSILLIFGSIAFNFFFWEETFGINLLLFSLLIIGTTIYTHKKAKYSRPFIYTAIGVLISGIAVSYHCSDMAKFTNITSTLLMIGFANQSKLRTPFYALPTSIANYFKLPKTFYRDIKNLGLLTVRSKSILHYTKLTLIPIAFLILFYMLFKTANPIFKEYTDLIYLSLSEWFTSLFMHISFPWVLFTSWGVSIVGWVVYKSDIKYFIQKEVRLSNTINRSKSKQSKANNLFPVGNKNKQSPMALKHEYQTALILICLVNVLLFIVNAIDINWIWFNFEYSGDINLSEFVHEGTYLLILSILISIGTILYFFRKNLNYLSGNGTLVVAASIWILQNIILVFSVAIRNIHYITHYGLAYKRIGVFIFLGLTTYGLITLFLKIKNKNSSFFILRHNSWSIYCAFVFMSIINWDMLIVKHNINHSERNNIDIEFLLSLSDKTLPVIDQNIELLDSPQAGLNKHYRDRYNERIKELLQNKKETSWLSWNLLEEKAFNYFISK